MRTGRVFLVALALSSSVQAGTLSNLLKYCAQLIVMDLSGVPRPSSKYQPYRIEFPEAHDGLPPGQISRAEVLGGVSYWYLVGDKVVASLMHYQENLDFVMFYDLKADESVSDPVAALAFLLKEAMKKFPNSNLSIIVDERPLGKRVGHYCTEDERMERFLPLALEYRSSPDLVKAWVDYQIAALAGYSEINTLQTGLITQPSHNQSGYFVLALEKK